MLKPLVENSDVETVRAYLSEQMASMCAKPGVTSPLHVLCSPKWYPRGLASIQRRSVSKPVDTIHPSPELTRLMNVTKRFAVEKMPSQDLAKNLASLLEMGSVDVACRYLQEALLELAPLVKSGKLMYPVQHACNAIRAREGMWQIEKQIANQELTKTVLDAQIFASASCDGLVNPISSLMGPWQKNSLSPSNGSNPSRRLGVPVVETSDKAKSLPPLPPPPPFVPRGVYRATWDTEEQVRTNAAGAKAALAALQGPAAGPTLDRDVIQVDDLQDGVLAKYKGYEYKFDAASICWKRIRVLRG